MTHPARSLRRIPSARYSSPTRATEPWKIHSPLEHDLPFRQFSESGGEKLSKRVDERHPRNRIDAGFRSARSSVATGNEILIFKPRHDTISVISIEATVGRRTRDGWNINADISLLCGSLTAPTPAGGQRLRFPGNDIAPGHFRRDIF